LGAARRAARLGGINLIVRFRSRLRRARGRVRRL